MKAKSTQHAGVNDPSWAMLLPYKPPFDWEIMLAAFRAHQLPHLEAVDDVAYERVIATKQGAGWFRVQHDEKRDALSLSGWNCSAEGLGCDLTNRAADVRPRCGSHCYRRRDENGPTPREDLESISGPARRRLVEWL